MADESATSSAENASSAGQSRDLTRALDDVHGGRPGAFARLVELAYADLRRIAAKRMRQQFDQPLDALTESPTAIANEAILKLLQQRTHFENRGHFFAIATRLVLYTISDYRKRRDAGIRGGGQRHAGDAALAFVPAPELQSPDDNANVLAALDQLHELEPRQAEVVTLRILAGHSMPEIARKLDVSLPTVERDWDKAKRWLSERLKP